MKTLRHLLIGSILMFCAPCVGAQQPSGSTSLPSAQQKQFLQQLKKPDKSAPSTFERAQVPAVPDDSVYWESAKRKGKIEQPLHVRDQAFILLDPALTPAEISAAIAQYNLQVIEDRKS